MKAKEVMGNNAPKTHIPTITHIHRSTEQVGARPLTPVCCELGCLRISGVSRACNLKDADISSILQLRREDVRTGIGESISTDSHADGRLALGIEQTSAEIEPER